MSLLLDGAVQTYYYRECIMRIYGRIRRGSSHLPSAPPPSTSIPNTGSQTATVVVLENSISYHSKYIATTFLSPDDEAIRVTSIQKLPSFCSSSGYCSRPPYCPSAARTCLLAINAATESVALPVSLPNNSRSSKSNATAEPERNGMHFWGRGRLMSS